MNINIDLYAEWYNMIYGDMPYWAVWAAYDHYLNKNFIAKLKALA